MKKILLSIVAIAAIVALPISATAASTTTVGTNTVTTPAITAAAKIIQPISIVTDGVQLNFGTIASSTSAATVLLTPANVRSIGSGTATLITTGALNIANTVPSFTVNGEPSAAYTITLPAGNVTLNGPSSNTMTVGSFTTSLGTGAAATAGTLTSGTQTFTLGASLAVGVSQASGSYTGTFNITVAYN
jgi:hypothetical protein